MSFLEQQQQHVDFDADHPLGVAEVPVVAVEAEVEAELERVVPEAFTVGCPKTAGWVVRRICAARIYQNSVKRWAEAERRRAEHEERQLFFLFGDALRRWTEAEIVKLRGRRRSVALPGGVVGFRAMQRRLDIRDEAAVIRWAKRACPSAIAISERLLKAPISQHVEQTGEVPEGIEIIVARDEFYIR